MTMAQADISEVPGYRPVVGAVVGWFTRRPFLIDVVAYNIDRRMRAWTGHAVRAREGDDESRQWNKILPDDKVKIVVQEYEHGVRHNI